MVEKWSQDWGCGLFLRIDATLWRGTALIERDRAHGPTCKLDPHWKPRPRPGAFFRNDQIAARPGSSVAGLCIDSQLASLALDYSDMTRFDGGAAKPPVPILSPYFSDRDTLLLTLRCGKLTFGHDPVLLAWAIRLLRKRSLKDHVADDRTVGRPPIDGRAAAFAVWEERLNLIARAAPRPIAPVTRFSE